MPIMIELKKFFTWIKPTHGYADVLIIISGILYILGYIVWSVNAFINNLGILPAFEFQYFFAGFVFLAVVSFVYVLIAFIYNIIADLFITTKSDKRLKNIQKKAAIISLILFILAFIMWYLSHAHWFVIKFEKTANVLLFISALLIIIVFIIGFLAFPDDPDFAKFFPYVVFGFCAFLGVVIYIFVFYPTIPQELGGVRPRCAYIDVVQKELSDKTIKAIIPNISMSLSNQVVRSRELDVMFAGKDFLLVKPHAEMQDSLNFSTFLRKLRTKQLYKQKRQEIYEIRKEVIRAIIWCGDTEKNSQLDERS